MSTHRSPARFGSLFALFAALLGCALLAGWLAYGRPDSGVDDAAIAFAYGDHLARGHGFVYNVGGERVEGFTSFLWVLLLAGLFSVFERVEIPLYVFNLAVLAAAAAAAARVLAKHVRFPGEPEDGLSYSVVIFAAWLVAVPAYASWSLLSLLEVGLYGALILMAASLLLMMALSDGADGRKARACFSALLALLVLVRPESMLLGPILIGLAGLVWSLRAGPREAVRRTAIPTAAFVVTLGALTLFRLRYFGYPLPNTYYAKVSPDLGYNLARGGEYLIAFIGHGPLVLLPLAAAVVGTPLRLRELLAGEKDTSDRDQRRILAEIVLGLLVVTLTLIPVLNGGDHFAEARFYQPLWPLLAMYALVRVHREIGGREPGGAVRHHRWRLAAAATAGLLIFGSLGGVPWHQVDRENPASFASEFHVTEWGYSKGRTLAEAVARREAPPSVGVVCAGGFKRGYPFEVVDLLGLNHVRMGHSRTDRRGTRSHAAFDRSVFFELSPELLMIDCGDFGQPCFPAGPEYFQVNDMLKGLLDDPAFNERYAPAHVVHAGAEVGAYVRRDRAGELESIGLRELSGGERCRATSR